MIGFWVDVGYTATRKTLTNLTDITFTDFNRPYTFVQPIDYTGGSWDGGYPVLLDKANEAFGSELYYIYAALVTYNGNYGQYVLEDWFPGLKNAYPNIYKTVVELDGKSVYVAFYFKSLKKVLYMGQGSSYSVYSVSDSGVLTPITPRPNVLAPVNAGTNRIFSICVLSPDYSKNKDLTDVNSFRSCSIYGVGGISGSNAVSISFTNAPGNYQGIPYLFTKDTVPDFDHIGPDNPYDPGGSSGPGDLPPGTFDDTSDPIPDSSLPSISASDTGFTRIYNPTLSQVQALAKYLWTDDTILETIWNHVKQYFEDPMQAIIGFNLVPCAVPDGGNREFALMYIGTGVYMNAAANQFVDVDCGTLDLERYYGSALDQSPYTKVSCFLPYIGMVDLNTDEVMGTTLQVKYRIDIVSGSCVAKILVDGNVLYQYSGHCAISIPISSADFTSYVSAAISVAKLAVAGAAAGMGAALATTAMGMASQETGHAISAGMQMSSSFSPIPQGGAGRGPAPASIDLGQEGGTGASFNGILPANITNTVGEIMGSKPTIQHSGSFSGNSGYLGVRRPFLIIERPNMCMPETYPQLNGFPCMITLKLGDCQGFTRVQQVQLTGVKATNPEQAELLSLLKMGVIL